MKKTIWILLAVGGVVLGVGISDLMKNLVNQVFGKDVFVTPRVWSSKYDKVKESLAQCTRKSEQNSQGLAGLAGEMKNKDFFALTRESVLSSIGSGKTGQRIMLRPAESEMMIKPSAADSQELSAVKNVINDKLKTVLDVSRRILREKVGVLNLELREINSQVQQRNQLLQEKLAELERYQKELDLQSSQIAELENIRAELETSVSSLETEIKNGQLKVSFKGDILFNSGSHKLRGEGKKLLRSVLPVLLQNQEGFDIFVAGHTDNVQIKPEARKRYDSNWDLSTYRAVEVVKLLTVLGLKPANLTAAGYGEFKPLVENSTAAGRQKNRRVEIFLIPKVIRRDAAAEN